MANQVSTKEATKTSRNMVAILFFKLLQVSAALLFAALIPRTMGPNLYGQFAFFISIVTISASIINLAINSIFGRFFPEFEKYNDKNLSDRLFSQMLLLKASVSIAFCIVLYLTLLLFYENKFPNLYYLIMVLIVFLTDLETIMFAVFFGFNNLFIFAMREPIRRFLSVGVIIVMFHQFNLIGAIFGSCLVSLFMLSLGVFLCRHYIEFSFEPISLSYLKPYLNFGIAISLSWILTSAWRSFGNILIDAITNDSQAVAYYDISQRIFLVASSVSLMLINSLIPIFTSLRINHKKEKIVEWSKRITAYLTVLNIVGLYIFYIFGIDFIRMVIGTEFTAVYSISILMLLCALPLVFIQIGYVMSVIYNDQIHYLKILCVSVLSFFILSYFLIQELTAIGCALALFISHCFMAILSITRFKKELTPCLRQGLAIILIGLLLFPTLLLDEYIFSNFYLLLLNIIFFLSIMFITKRINLYEIRDIIFSLKSSK